MSETNSQEVKSCNINYNLFKTFMKFSFALKIVLNYFFFLNCISLNEAECNSNAHDLEFFKIFMQWLHGVKN